MATKAELESQVVDLNAKLSMALDAQAELTPTVHEAIRRVSNDVGVVEPDATMAVTKNERGPKVPYRSAKRVMAALHPALIRHGVTIAPTDTSIVWQGPYEGQRLVGILQTFVITGPAGDSITTQVYAEGMNSRDKAAVTALTVAWRQLVTYLFCIPVSLDDPEANTTPEPGPATPPPRAVHDPVAGPLSGAALDGLARRMEELGTEGAAAFLKAKGWRSAELTMGDIDQVMADLDEYERQRNTGAPDTEAAAAKLHDAFPGSTETDPDHQLRIARDALIRDFTGLPEAAQPAAMAELDKAGLVPLAEIPTLGKTEVARAILVSHGAPSEEPFE